MIGEDVLVPSTLMTYSIQRHKELGGGQSTVRDIATLLWRDGVDQVDLNAANLDPIVALFLCVCRVCMMEKMCINGGLIDVLSPQVSSSVVWCLSQIVHPYIHLAEDSYEQVKCTKIVTAVYTT